MRIGGIECPSTIDWYGKVASVIFCAGCNYKCHYCQNSELIYMGSGSSFDWWSIYQRVKFDYPLIDAIVFTGGEPTLQPVDLIQLCTVFKGDGKEIMIDTNGTGWNVIDILGNKQLIDRVALDVKAPLFPLDYTNVINVGFDDVLIHIPPKNTMKYTKDHGLELEVRTTIVPGLIDRPEQIKRIAEQILPYADVYYLQQFIASETVLNPRYRNLLSPTREEMVALSDIASDVGVETYIKTIQYGLEKVSGPRQ